MLITKKDIADPRRFHDPENCEGAFCPLHNPSNHKMRDWPMNLRTDSWAFPLIERICPHGIGHPDPDSVAYLERNTKFGKIKGTWGIHGCDGCCGGMSRNPPRLTASITFTFDLDDQGWYNLHPEWFDDDGDFFATERMISTWLSHGGTERLIQYFGEDVRNLVEQNDQFNMEWDISVDYEP